MASDEGEVNRMTEPREEKERQDTKKMGAAEGLM